MNKNQLARLARHRKVQQTLTDQAPAVASVPAFARLATEFGQQLALLNGAATKNAITSEGATLTKNTAGTALTARLVKVANALYLLYKSENNLEEAAKMHRNPTDYRSMGELVFATEAADLSRRAAARAKDLAYYNLNAADLKTLAAEAAAFDGLLGSPQLALDAGKINGATATARLSALNRFLQDDFRAGLELLRDSQPGAYQALKQAAQVDDAGHRKGKAAK